MLALAGIRLIERIRLAFVGAVAGLSTLGCVGTPSPLAPGLHGSVGLPSQGVLTDGAELPVAGVGFERYRPHSPNYWGVPRLVAAIESAAAKVSHAVPGSSTLLVGDLSASTGGKIPHHASHRTGRDVDLLYYFTDLYGQPVRSPGFACIGSDSIAAVPGSHEFVRLDVEREWQLTRSLLTDSSIEIVWMFVSRDVEALLLQRAIALGEPAWIIWRAEQVLHQPRDSAPHDDHMHLRIACTSAERQFGCEGGGPFWPWFAPTDQRQDLAGVLLEAVARDEPLAPASEWMSSNGRQTALQ